MRARLANRFPKLFTPPSLRKQLLARSLIILSVLLLLIGGLQYVLMRNFIYTNRAESMETQIRSMPRELLLNFLNGSEGAAAGGEAYPVPPVMDSGGGPEIPFGDNRKGPDNLRTDGNRRPLLLDAHTTLALYSPDGTFNDLRNQTLSDSPAPRLSGKQLTERLKHTSDKATGKYTLIPAEDGSEHLAIFMNLGRPGEDKLLLQMSVNTAPLKDVAIQQLLIFAALSLAALLAGFFMYLPALRKTLVPLSKMEETARIIDAGNLDVRFPVNQGQSEIDMLSHSFNGMLERLEVSFHNEREAKEQMRRFAADASHELRTPLTSIHGFLEVLLRGAADNREQLYNALRSMHGESRRINKLVEDLLLLARMDGAPQLRLKELHLGEMLTEMQPQLLVLAGSRKVSFDISYGIRGNYDPDKIKQVILNLFQNAVQHTDDGKGVIHLALSARENRAELILSDNGSGISAEHLPHVFDRFYRSDTSRARKYGGSGLGLSITKSIVEAHGGEISVNSTLEEGTTFKVTLPCTQGYK